MVRTLYLIDYYYDYYAGMLRREARKRGFTVARLPPGVIPGKRDVVIWTDVRSYLAPARFRQALACRKAGVQQRLVLLEPPVVHPYNYLRIMHLPFPRVYTWNDRLLGGTYRKHRWPQDSAGRTLAPVPFRKRKLLAIFCANKRPALPWHPGSLYGARVRAMRFFTRERPSQFAIYGKGWDKPATPWERMFGTKGYTTWKGWVDDKLGHLKRYKFSICYENQRGKQGYITEKIWDSLKARCVPIYWGAENIDAYVPEGCYIDRRQFASDAAVLAFIEAMTEEEHDAYVRRIDRFVRSKAFDAWTYDAWARTLLEGIR